MANKEELFRLTKIAQELAAGLAALAGQDTPEPEAPPVVVVPPPAKAITPIVFESTGGEQAMVPFTFGQVFAVGDLAAGEQLHGRFDNLTPVPLQLDVKALHADGSVRHAVVSGYIPQIQSGSPRTMGLMRGAPSANVFGEPKPSTKVETEVRATIGGVLYTANLGELLKVGKTSHWLKGDMAEEVHVSAPLADKLRNEHPHLNARFAVRRYLLTGQVRVDVAIENSWAYEPGPQNFNFDVQIVSGMRTIYEKKNFLQYHHARWRRVFWIGETPAIHERHDPAYWIDTRALPNYDRSVKISEAHLVKIAAEWTGPKTEPMGIGAASAYMPATGGRGDIGILPLWAAVYLLSQDPRAKMVMLGTADNSGSWSSHYRDRYTDQPISLIDYPYMTLLGRSSDTYNRPLQRFENFPPFGAAETRASPYSTDTDHQPGLSYLPYLMTGDFYHLEELQSWAMWCAFRDNPNYREREKGLVKQEQVRGQAWSLRTIAQAAYITPDDDRLKAHFTSIVEANAKYYNDRYINTPATSNNLGVLTNGYGDGFNYEDGTARAPWQDDHLTSVVGHVVDLGFESFRPFLQWKVRYSILRMIGDGACPVHAAMYTMKLRDTKSSPLYTTIKEAFEKSIEPKKTAGLPCGGPEMAKVLGLKVGEMTGYASTAIGYASNMQAALAYAADVGGEDGKRAWNQYMQRTNFPDYSSAPMYALLPRTM